MKILVTGAKGMLGIDLCSILEEAHEVEGYDIDDFDITDAGQTSAAVLEVSPSVIVHAAAFTGVDACEEARDRAFRVNVGGSENVARAAAEAGCLLVYLSTDYVFEGSKATPYTETDAPGPINYYGLTKLQGEDIVRDLTSRHLIVRTSWLFGPNGKNFVDTITTKALETGSLKVVDDQRGCPTYTYDLAKGLRAVIEKGMEGTVHLTNRGSATWFELARYTIETAEIDADIEPIETAAWPTKAKRPAYTVMASDVLGEAGVEPLPPWEHGVVEHLARRGFPKDKGTS
jgi:dTDP-4-dehydrorhamnose reductase